MNKIGPGTEPWPRESKSVRTATIDIQPFELISKIERIPTSAKLYLSCHVCAFTKMDVVTS